MAFLGDIGQKYPVVTEGYEVPIDDETTEMYAGDILQTQLTFDGDINADLVREMVHGTLKMKEEYPYFVLHYMEFETRRVTIQYSLAPVGQTGSAVVSALIWKITWAIIAVIGALIAYALIKAAIERQWIFPHKPAVGDALAIAKDSIEEMLLPNVPISTNGKEGTTGASGEGLLFEDLLVGDHVFVGGAVEGYQEPKPVTKPVIKDKLTNVTIWYDPEGHVPPTHGWLAIDTSPIKAKVWVDGTPYGQTYQIVEVEAGDHIVSFDAVEGWLTPEQQTHTVQGGKQVGVIGYYTKPPGRWYEKYIMYALIGGGAIIGAAVLVPKLISALTRRKE